MQNKATIKYDEDSDNEEKERMKLLKSYQKAQEIQKSRQKQNTVQFEEKKSEPENISRFLNTRDDSLKNKKLKELVQKNQNQQLALNTERAKLILIIDNSVGKKVRMKMWN